MEQSHIDAAPQSTPTGDTHVRRRQVFFIPGYDPIAPRRYRELYRTEAARQARISGYDIKVEAAPRNGGNYGWLATATIDGTTTRSRIEFLTWEDIVRTSMNRSILSTYLVMLRTVWIYLASGAFFRLFRLRAAPMLAALYPVLVLVAQLELAALIVFLVWVFVPLPAPISLALGIGGGVALLIACYRYDNRIFAYYLINDYGFTAQHWGRWPDALQARMAAFSDRIAAALADEAVDEVLVVGHSSGAHIGVAVMADVLAKTPPATGPALSFLSLGHVIPMMSFLPRSDALRRALNTLSASERIAWIDISAPGDGGCFALSDPVHVTGVAPPEPEKRWPKVISAAFSETMTPEKYRATRFRFFRRHVQYLCAFGRPRDYDYFKITAGPQTLGDRFAWRGATASRKEKPLSGYRSM